MKEFKISHGKRQWDCKETSKNNWEVISTGFSIAENNFIEELEGTMHVLSDQFEECVEGEIETLSLEIKYGW